MRFLLRFVFEKNAHFFRWPFPPASRVIPGFSLLVCVIGFMIDFVIGFMIDLRSFLRNFLRIFSGIFHPIGGASEGGGCEGGSILL
ncbi:hypothetical protein MA984_005131 [Escherichia coli]|nr:hypothetical protein [Escherichia coli]EJA1493066.1 hypothetical protein [Escherichia coli]EJQ0131250.1 hypothetical protein [Escherichia coli]